MTIRESNWCEDCQEECTGHSRVCTMCGGSLSVRPSSNNRPAPSFRAMPDIDAFLPPGLSTAGLGTADLLSSVRQQVQATTTLAQQAIDNNNNAGDWQAIPEALLDPQSGGGKTPTKKEVLKKLPREVLTEKSASFFQVVVEIDGQQYKGVTGNLGPLPALNEENEINVTAPLWIPKSRAQRTGKEPLTAIPEPPFIALSERGDGISFFTKAYAAETQGAVAAIVLNDKAEPWPYVMKDSRTRSQKDNQGEVSIPTIMLSISEKPKILQKQQDNITQCSLSINQKHATCVVCREALQLGQTTLTLTNYCGHVFHEACALQWLQNHNTCPYCRRSLPTDEAGNEQERLRQMTTSSEAGEAFYS